MLVHSSHHTPRGLDTGTGTSPTSDQALKLLTLSTIIVIERALGGEEVDHSERVVVCGEGGGGARYIQPGLCTGPGDYITVQSLPGRALANIPPHTSLPG